MVGNVAAPLSGYRFKAQLPLKKRQNEKIFPSSSCHLFSSFLSWRESLRPTAFSGIGLSSENK